MVAAALVIVVAFTDLTIAHTILNPPLHMSAGRTVRGFSAIEKGTKLFVHGLK